jgi:C1A family cysteine protease
MRRYTWKPDLPDHRDHLYALPGTPLPSHVDLRPKCSPVEDQGQLGSCTAHALAGALEFLEGPSGNGFYRISRLFVYWNERNLEGTVSQDSGAQIRDGVKTLATLGACHETLWPYVIAQFKRKPSAKCYTDAAGHKISEYLRVTSLAGSMSALAAGFPVVFGFSVYSSFESDQVAQSGIVNLPAKGEQLLGGHAVLAVGYDNPSQRLIVRNSWGASWGQQGYFTMPFEYVANPRLASDFWTIRK